MILNNELSMKIMVKHLTLNQYDAEEVIALLLYIHYSLLLVISPKNRKQVGVRIIN